MIFIRFIFSKNHSTTSKYISILQVRGFEYTSLYILGGFATSNSFETYPDSV